ncbi:SDR family oxidoreductase [Corynebacterium mendelii]|uniref:SDR family NAD(P)-dependent oxidoreductase n=1 Tax=Corynebacterium mendelii TaxID=2765362 RepID=A0A939E0Y5_9CORY|nr:SDR family NAD(P)-dependent oxidoreductase [Corynebacterium mendelii]MBN9644414.1 SDR family NAD(P)-dependent oxidoreductase [Corynebacterium mendelii]
MTEINPCPSSRPGEGKTALVTGASAGIGEATARALAADGWHVICAARRAGKVKKIAADIGGTAAVVDVTDPDSVAVLAEAIDSLDLLVNNAGGALGLDHVADGLVEDWRVMYETNVIGTLQVTQALVDKLIAANGLVVTMCSIAGHHPYRGGGGYNAAKHGQSALNKCLRIETAGTTLRVTEINPGRVHTDFSVNRFKGDRDKAAKVYENNISLTAGDVAEAVRWVASLPAHVNIDTIQLTPTDQVV